MTIKIYEDNDVKITGKKFNEKYHESFYTITDESNFVDKSFTNNDKIYFCSYKNIPYLVDFIGNKYYVAEILIPADATVTSDAKNIIFGTDKFVLLNKHPISSDSKLYSYIYSETYKIMKERLDKVRLPENEDKLNKTNIFLPGIMITGCLIAGYLIYKIKKT